MKVYGLVGGQGEKLLLQALNGRLPQPALRALLPDDPKIIPADFDPKVMSYAFKESLRVLVNAWIESGRTEGIEQPWERVVPPELRDCLKDYVWRNPPLLQFTAEGPALSIYPHTWDSHKELPLLLLKSVTADLQDTPLTLKIMAFVADAAIAVFLQMLDSPGRTRLFRCDECRTYFLRQRMPKKDTPIERGSYCENCKREGKDRIRRTEDSRGKRTGQMIEWAADAWLQWKRDRRHGERAEWVAREVNAKLGKTRDPIKTNWVTRHKAEIEAEVERRDHAKG
jgi:hypothetical protein